MKRFVCHINNLLMRIGKPLKVTGVVLLLVIFIGGCGPEDISEAADDTEYTDVEYSQDGTSITIYLDGVGVPKTRSQRAISKDLAQTAFDLIEVIFFNGDSAGTYANVLTNPANVVRTSWILGQPANVENIQRGVNYNRCYFNNDGASGGAVTSGGTAACMFVGRDDSKTLLGVGKLTGIRPTVPGNSTASPWDTMVIDDSTTSITFSIAALQTGLLVGDETVAGNTFGVVVDSLNYYDSGNQQAGGYRSRNGHSYRKTIGGKSYPVYSLPLAQGAWDNGTAIPENTSKPPEGDASYTLTYVQYKFSFVGGDTMMATTSEYRQAIRHVSRDSINITKKTPRYVDGLRYLEPRSSIDTVTTVRLPGAYIVSGPNYRFNNLLQLRFSTSASKGLFSFNLEIPVFMVTDTAAGRNNGTAAVIWKIRTGVGTEFYSLDDGVTRGGCVLMATGVSEEEFDAIEWTWFR